MRPMDAKPTADAALVLRKAKELAILFDKELDSSIVTQAAEMMWNTYQFDSGTTVSDAQNMLFVEQHPKTVVFENSNARFIAKNGNENWQVIKQIGFDTTLADFRDFLDALIVKYGSGAEFYMDSDHGDEYFILKLKGK